MADAATNFVNDVKSGIAYLDKHEAGGAWAALIGSIVLTIWVWYVYGPVAGAPLAASFFIMAAFLFPTGK